MALSLYHSGTDVDWAVWKIEESSDELLSLFSEKELYEAEMSGFASANRRLEWLSVRALLCRMVGEEKKICYDLQGRPYPADRSFHLSISHTKGYVAVIIGFAGPVGIDIEQYGQRVHRVADRFMRADETASAYEGDDTWGLLLHWSAKETLFKCIREADADLRNLRLEPFEIKEEGCFCVQEYWTKAQRTWCVNYRLHPQFVLTWATDSE